jgi:hypothetical protein
MNNNPKLAAMAVFLAVFACTTFVETDRWQAGRLELSAACD